MSLSSTTLTDFVEPQVETETVDVSEQATEMREEALDGGARYRNPVTTDASDAGEDLASGTHECQNCGETVTPTYHRANSDNDGVLWHCGSCVTASDMKNGAGAKPEFVGRCPDTGGAIYGSL